MPEPDPEGIEIEEGDDGGFRVVAQVWDYGNRRHRLARMRAVMWNMRRDRWRCEECGEPVPSCRRTDARYCGEGCRKRQARRRRAGRIDRASWGVL